MKHSLNSNFYLKEEMLTRRSSRSKEDLSVPRISITSKSIWTSIPLKIGTKLPQFGNAPIINPLPEPQEIRVENPFIQRARLFDGELKIILLVPSPNSAVAKLWGAHLLESFCKSSDGGKEKKEQVGPYRSAAVWEFIGKTFQKSERQMGKKRKYKRRYRCYAQGVGNVPGASSLSQRVLTSEEEEEYGEKDKEVLLFRAELTNFR
jgi:hypothetical protein